MSQTVQQAAAANSQGMNALRQGDFGAAAKYFEQAVAADPHSGALLRNLASAHRGAGNDEAELNALDQALDIDRRDLVAWMRKAELHQRREEKGEAFQAWNVALQLAEPLRPWSGPMAEALALGQAFAGNAGQVIRASVESAMAPMQDDLGETERRRVKAFVDIAVGQRRIFANECHGLCYPFLPADEFFDEGHFPWFGELAAKTEAIRDELIELMKDPGEALRPYVNMESGIGDNKWSGLDHSLDWGAIFLWEYGAPNKPVLERCPETAAILDSLPGAKIPGRAPSAFFSMLKPRTRIPPHTGVTNTRAIIHLPLIVPGGCGFRVGGDTRPWVVGKPFAFDDTIEHEAWNDSDELRAVLIFDVWNPHLSKQEQDAIARYYAAADSAGYNPQLSE
ncbi:aspartyl/asparaginyl beta-hydroxylase domain-containing protein [Sphingomonas sp. NSE70-1]|uniref:Aspartyl/asparaginyl beta-hydroxylase domain-containing protein n=1 Tax=Sphingomonas caseinilyticus TaxID=2908205 RepID=A0ABT0RVT0_9SPHN|nr:aspartyl/asparaginyl beta-hydroxylase domain-containing protein [Sphingomonas caseinilyticus]MCL6699056.1 aspartyl/asparaginyl beta-hydroxylase domain-containing protein [Sphingomonas caseinilyticus]